MLYLINTTPHHTTPHYTTPHPSRHILVPRCGLPHWGSDWTTTQTDTGCATLETAFILKRIRDHGLMDRVNGPEPPTAAATAQWAPRAALTRQPGWA